MKVQIVIFLVAFAQSEMVSGCQLVDTEIDNDAYNFNEIKKMSGVISWQKCGDICDATNGCHFWTWYDDKALCSLKTSKNTQSHVVGAISGTRGCKSPPTRCHGGDSCCTSSSPCGENEGDCDSNADCLGELKCGQGSGFDDNCPNTPTFDSTDDCCYDPNKAILCHGGDSCCTSSSPCGENEGDCDSDADCLGKLKCGQGSGFDDNCPNTRTFDSTDDCCYDPDKGMIHPCPTSDGPQYALVNGKCLFFEEKQFIYQDAKVNCADKMTNYGKGKLFEPNSFFMNVMVAAKAKDIFSVSWGWAYIGVNDFDEQETYVYETNSNPVAFNPNWYTNYGPGGIFKDYDDECVIMGIYSANLGVWAEAPCLSSKRFSICE